MSKTMSSFHGSQSSVRALDAEAQKTSVCSVCGAVYAPSPAHAYLLQAPPVAVESAFMSMCHFCFRCRRPACPACWDDVHGVCGACVLEAHLPFRAEAPPLDGVIFPALRQAPFTRQRSATAPLLCVQPGRFQVDAPPVVRPSAPEPSRAIIIVPETRQFENVVEEPAKTPQQVEKVVDAVPVSRHIERILTVILLIVLLIIVILIVLALWSEEANRAIASILHIDIRAEVAYLLQLLQQLH